MKGDYLAEVSIPISKSQFGNVSVEGGLRCEATDWFRLAQFRIK